MDAVTEKGAFPWKVRGIVKKGDYNYAIVPEHPNSTKHGYVLEHRIVVENQIKRLLTPHEIVHHRDGNKKNNRPENLEITNRKTHAKNHQLKVGRAMVKLRCPECLKTFNLQKRQSFLQKGTRFSCCSKYCSRKFSWKIRRSGITREVENAISANLLKEFKIFQENAEVTQD